MTSERFMEPTRREVLSMIAAGAVIMSMPKSLNAKSLAKPFVTKTIITEPISDNLFAKIVARRSQKGLISQKILQNESSTTLIEEWNTPASQGANCYHRKEI